MSIFDASGQVDRAKLEAALDGVRDFLDSVEAGTAPFDPVGAEALGRAKKDFIEGDRDPHGPEADAYLAASAAYFGVGAAHGATLDEVGR